MLEPKSAAGQQRDLAHWLLMPWVTLIVAGPVFLASTGLALLDYGTCTAADQGCASAQASRIWSWFTIGVFVAGWLSLWCLPWWRGLRRVRTIVAVAALAPVLLTLMYRLSQG
jgi:hypothetical protein